MKFGWIQESAGIQAVRRDEVSPFLAADGQPEPAAYGAEAAIRREHGACRLGNAEARPCRNFDHQARFVAIFSRWSSRHGFDRLNRVQRNLVGEDLALLVRNGLPIYRERILGVVTESVKQAVRVCHHARRRQRHQRTHRRRLALQWHPFGQVGVHVRMKTGVVLYQVSTICFHRDARCRCADLQTDLYAGRYAGAYIHVLCV